MRADPEAGIRPLQFFGIFPIILKEKYAFFQARK